jgi:hypothetical protein
MEFEAAFTDHSVTRALPLNSGLANTNKASSRISAETIYPVLFMKY